MPHLFSEFQLKDITLKNRIVVPPMGQYSAVDGVINDWHMVNLGARAVGGAGLLIAEATAVSPEGRVSLGCPGIWTDEQAEAWARVVSFVKAQGATIGIQLAHSGRKGSTNLPWEGDDHFKGDDPRSWDILAPSARAFGGDLDREPKQMSLEDIKRVQGDFVAAAKRALAAGFEWLELHFAHGYLAQSFLSPHANHRDDEYGGSLLARSRFLLETLSAVREVWPERLPLTARLGITDYLPDGVQVDDAIEVVKLLKQGGLDLIDISLSFNTPDVSQVPWAEQFLVPHGDRIRREVDIPLAVGGNIFLPKDADAIIREGKADLVMLARGSLANPHWPYTAARALGHPDPTTVLPVQYGYWLNRDFAAEQEAVKDNVK